MRTFLTAFVLILIVLPNTALTNPVSASLIYDLSHISSGGMSTSGGDNTNEYKSEQTPSRILATIAYQTSVFNHTSFYIDTSFFRGDNGSGYSQDLQGYSNIDAHKHSKLHQAWFSQKWQSLPLTIKVGWIDANTDFAVAEHAAHFIHSSMGFSPSITNMPTYPNPRLGGQIKWQFAGKQTLKVAAFADQSEHFSNQFSIAEYQFPIKFELPIQIKLGSWYQAGQADLSAASDNTQKTQKAFGFYSVIQGQLPLVHLFNQQPDWYLQLATSNDKTSPISQHLGFGFIFTHQLNRQLNHFGLGVTHIKTSQYTQQQFKSHETAIEAFYQYKINSYFSVKPNLQYINEPAAQLNTKNALIATLRAEFNF